MTKKALLAAALALVLTAAAAACGKKEAEEAKPAGQGQVMAWMSYDEGMEKSRVENKPAFVVFCSELKNAHDCQMFEEKTLKDQEIVSIANESFVPIKVNADGTGPVTFEGNQLTEKELALRLKVTRYPVTWFFDANGKPIGPLPGNSPPDTFKASLTFITSGSQARGMKFSEYYESVKNK